MRHSGFNPRTRTGCDTQNAENLAKTYQFQSTHPHGVRLRIVDIRLKDMHVSIHAPARGATQEHHHHTTEDLRFNPRTRTGCDGAQPRRDRASGFQSTHPHGVRRHHVEQRPSVLRFNPRTRTGCDQDMNEGRDQLAGFNPRTRTGCDAIGRPLGKRGRAVSIHAPARGATLFVYS